MSRTVVGGFAGAFALAALTTAVACGSFEEAEEGGPPARDGAVDGPADGTSTTDGGGTDAVALDGESDAAANDGTLTAIPQPWYIRDTVGSVVVTSKVASGGVYRVAKDNGLSEKIGLRPAFGVAVRGLDVWYCSADPNNPGLVFVPLMGGTNVSKSSASCLEVAATGSDVFFTGGSRDVVENLLPDGGVGSIPANHPEGIGADGAGVYWAELHGNRIGAVKAGDNGMPSTIVSGIGPEPRRVVITNDYVYWVEFLTKEVQRTKHDGTGGAELIAVGPDLTREGGIAADLMHVYWVVAKDKADGGPGGGVYRVPRAGGVVQPVIESLDMPIDVAVDDDFVYVTVQNENRVVRIRKN